MDYSLQVYHMSGALIAIFAFQNAFLSGFLRQNPETISQAVSS